MGDRSSSIAQQTSRSTKQQPQEAALRHASRGQPRLRDRAPGSPPEVHPAVPDPRHRHRARTRSGASARPCRACARTTRSRRTPTGACSRCWSQEGAGFEIASTAELDLLLGAGRAGGRDLLLQPDEVARRDRLRRGQGRGVVRGRQRGRAAARPRGQARRQAVPAHRHPQHRQRLAALGQVRRGVADAREIVAAAAKLRRGPRRRHLPRRLAVPQPGELARRAREGEGPVRRHGARPASSRACSTSAAATRCATSSRSPRSR